MSTLLIVGLIAGVIGWIASNRREHLQWFSVRIDTELARRVGDLSDFRAFQKRLPGFRFVDLYHAIERIAEVDPEAERIESEHQEFLATILEGLFYMKDGGRIRKPNYAARTVDRTQDAFFPTDGFVILRLPEDDRVLIVRLKLEAHSGDAVLEVGATSHELAETVLTRILKLASEFSIYRGHTLEVSFEPEVKDSFGDIEKAALVDVRFRPTYAVSREDIILDDDLRELIDRTIVDFHRRRDELRALGLPSKRGLLFYGPPGTGKTYMCKYLAHTLDDVTTIVSAGRSLFHIRSVCQIARMLKPALIVLEDVDLVFSSREITASGASLGELMDELDGFSDDDEILFILTTNALERVEGAIKDRPGRISQCVYFDFPGTDLRHRYLTRLTALYDISNLDMQELVHLTDRTSQAFLKELVFRAVQVASEKQSPDVNRSTKQLALALPHFQTALREMKESAGAKGAAILGFQAA